MSGPRFAVIPPGSRRGSAGSRSDARPTIHSSIRQRTFVGRPNRCAAPPERRRLRGAGAGVALLDLTHERPLSAMLRHTVIGLAALALAAGAATLHAQYFGRNKVEYEEFKFAVLKTEHFDVYFYPVER